MNSILREFRALVKTSFKPPKPSRDKSESTWLVSRSWSKYMKSWLRGHYAGVQYERPLGRRRRLDAALWRSPLADPASDLPMDIALEWEWDNNKVAADFVAGDFRKLLRVHARCGIAIIQTRTDGRRGSSQAEATLFRLQESCRRHRKDNRSVGLIEFRRVRQDNERVEFTGYFHDLVNGSKHRIRSWAYHSRAGGH